MVDCEKVKELIEKAIEEGDWEKAARGEKILAKERPWTDWEKAEGVRFY